jgi:multidrug efflux pump subunit AcrB
LEDTASIDDVNNVVEAAIGGMTLTTIEGDSVSVNARYAQEYRNSIEDLKLQVQTMEFANTFRRRRRYKNKRWTSDDQQRKCHAAGAFF